MTDQVKNGIFSSTKMAKNSKTVFVAMSGGVDSSVAAALLKQRGFEVVGVFMKNWDATAHNANLRMDANGANRCSSESEYESARLAAEKIGIPLYTWNFEDEYRKKVFAPMLEGYREGKTPNPDVECNRHIKFGFFLDRALRLGADYIATGHYTRKREIKNQKSKIKNYELLAGIDKNKDQSYFLWTLTQEQLSRTLFPIGDFQKSEVRKMARNFGLPNALKPDSQGLCFVGKVRFSDFIQEFLPPQEGVIATTEGKVVGKHRGIQFYTIGQRHGLRVGGGTPYFVVAKDAESNTILVAKEGEDAALYQQRILAENVNWISGIEPQLPLRVFARIRYRQPLEEAEISLLEGGNLALTFAKPQRGASPGQSTVFYNGDEVLGGGVIFSAPKVDAPLKASTVLSASTVA